MAILAGVVFCAGVIVVITRAVATGPGSSIEQPGPQQALPPPPTESSGPEEPEPSTREEEQWQQLALGPFSVQLPGSPHPDETTGWFDRYAKVTRTHAYRLPVTHRQSHIRISTIHYEKGKISLNAAALGAKQAIEAEFPGVTTVQPFTFRDLDARQLTTRPVDLADLTRQHSYLLIHGSDMLILSVRGHDQHPNRLAHQILRTVALQPKGALSHSESP
jgi:hypothetical protein